MAEKTYMTQCFFYHEEKDMGATVPYCANGPKIVPGYCPCTADCKAFIGRNEATDIIREYVKNRK